MLHPTFLINKMYWYLIPSIGIYPFSFDKTRETPLYFRQFAISAFKIFN